MSHQGLGSITVCSSDDPRLTLTYFMTRSKLVVCVFEWGKLLNGHLIGIYCVANDQIMFMIKV